MQRLSQCGVVRNQKRLFICTTIAAMLLTYLTVSLSQHFLQTSSVLKAQDIGAEYFLNASAEIQPKARSVAIFSYAVQTDEYAIATTSVACYAAVHNYTYLLIYENDLWLQRCPQKHVFFRRHCVLQHFLDQYDYILVLDADIGVVNPKREIEEWIDPNFDVIFYERLFSREVSTASFIVRNSKFSRKLLNLLVSYAEKGFSGKLSGDNVAIHVVLVDIYAPNATKELMECMQIWDVATTYHDMFVFDACIWLILGRRKKFGHEIKIVERGHAWVRDPYITRSRWCFQSDFMFHNWKGSNVKADDPEVSSIRSPMPFYDWFNPFARPLNQSDCPNGNALYYWKRYLIVDDWEIKEDLKVFDRQTRRQFHDYVREINNFIKP